MKGDKMTAKEMIDKLSLLPPPETMVYWEDAIEGNDCEVAGFLKTTDEEGLKVFVSPGVYKVKSDGMGRTIVTDELKFGELL